MSKLVFWEKGWEDYLQWQADDKKLLKKINRLLQEIGRDPFNGTGKPEPLTGDLSGFWSRRINGEHRIVYRLHHNTIEILSCKGHYEY